MKLIPASRAFATIRDDVASSVGPPNIMVPRQIGEISGRCGRVDDIASGGSLHMSGTNITARDRHCERKRSNPFLREKSMDCFVALLLAMTWRVRYLNPRSSIS